MLQVSLASDYFIRAIGRISTNFLFLFYILSFIYRFKKPFVHVVYFICTVAKLSTNFSPFILYFTYLGSRDHLYIYTVLAKSSATVKNLGKY